jgi:hypothetical protein
MTSNALMYDIKRIVLKSGFIRWHSSLAEIQILFSLRARFRFTHDTVR